ncbi:dihydrolipoamide acetyltransferase family protein [Sulfoacidibacillus thermotolerans]|uniref:Dihydrolipoamide acetyltransferase component of pyruvate dehydrogenase complex n=1 Tax=Sulfoacidibacillus thermotolerans TaxID=1765684 RepID=A0A2U3D869_SULT2|nr:dihydrolipoamide acetyltransferase family protein [Sulfoacidibacillus thermotolerans]PWI57449.1 hypothetical protein BM613_08215 [Sulfoacidibacillus thermotolerans]
MFEFTLPQTSDDIFESVIVIWYKSEGEKVRAGDVVVEVQTEKATFELESPVTGRLHKIVVNRAESAKVGDVLALFDLHDEEKEKESEGEKEQASETVSSIEQEQFISMSPRLRRLAKQLGVDPQTVVGTGPHGRITEEDIRNQAAPDSTPHPSRMQATRVAIAERMSKSLQQTAQVTLHRFIDVTELAQRRKELDPDASFNDWILRAVAIALSDHPDLNGSTKENSGTKQVIHLGIATDTEEGLLVPVLRNAHELSLKEIHLEVQRLVKGAHSHTLSPFELSGSTFTVTNLGTYGITFFTPILNPPESGILGVGQIEEYITRDRQELRFRKRLPLSLTFDHRVIDGGPAARFLQTMSHVLDNPDHLL